MNVNILGPEFRRNVWIRFTPFSIAVVPILIGLAALGLYVTWETQQAFEVVNGNHYGLYQIHQHWSTILIGPALVTFVLVACILGCYEAAAAFTDEQKNKTWDLQKTSAIKPIHLVVGKLLGSTSYAWYFGLAALLVFFYGYSHYMWDATPNITGLKNPRNSIGPVLPATITASPLEMFYVAFYLILAAFSGHVAALFGSLQNITSRKHAVFGSFIAGLIISYTVFQAAVQKMALFHNGNLVTRAAEPDAHVMNWFNYKIDFDLFVLCSILFFLFWACVALYRNTRAELQFRGYPWPWFLFLVTFVIYMMGMVQDDQSPFAQLVAPLGVMFIICYHGLYHNADNLGGYKMFLGAFRRRDWRKFFENFPRWLVSVIVLFGVTVSFFALMHFNPPIKGKPFDITSYYKNEMRSFVFVLTLWLFMARDALAAHYFLLGERFKHGTFMLVVYYILAYGLLPLLFVGPEVRNLFQQFDVDRLGGPHSWYFFYPSYTLEYGAAILPIALQVVLLAVLLWHGTRQYRQQITS